MEKELNIAEMLKNKPKGLKLWSDTFGELIVDCIDEQNDAFPIYLKVRHGNNICLTKDGCYYSDEAGTLPCIVPSKSMRDWSKFAWKKGDVLATDINTYCIFDSWENGAYTQFRAKYICRISDCHFYSDEVKPTCDWTRVKENDIIEYYINIIERSKGGKLNLSTLEIEKQEFKDGDILVVNKRNQMSKGIIIFDEKSQPADFSIQISISAYAFYDVGNNILTINDEVYVDGRKLRSATDSEKQQLFDALAKDGKRWNAETKTLEDLPKKCEFKPMDWCLMRIKGDCWKLCQFGFKGEDKEDPGFNAIGGSWFDECIPYNDKTAHLLGTNDDYEEGGEG